MKRYYFLFLILVHYNVWCQQHIVQQTSRLEFLKNELQAKQLEQQMLFSALKVYTQHVGKVAHLLVKIKHTCNKHEQISPKWSLKETSQAIDIVISLILAIIDFAHFQHQKNERKKLAAVLSHQEFVDMYPHLAILECNIALMKFLIELSLSGSFAEQLFARIHLTGMALPKPYADYTKKASLKMYKQCFDANGHVIVVDIKPTSHPYKKFIKKVAQTWQELVVIAPSVADFNPQDYVSCCSVLLKNQYNDAILSLIQALQYNDQAKKHACLKQLGMDLCVQRLLNLG